MNFRIDEEYQTVANEIQRFQNCTDPKEAEEILNGLKMKDQLQEV